MHNYSKEYGDHEYPEEGDTSLRNCVHKCGCYVASFTSGGPLGLDPLGECPHNPKNGERLPGAADYEIVVTRRIRAGEEAEAKLRRISKPKKKLAEELDAALHRLSWYMNFVHRLRQGLKDEPGEETATPVEKL